MGAEAEVGDHDWTVISGQSNRSFDFRFDLEQVDDAIEVFLVDVDEVGDVDIFELAEKFVAGLKEESGRRLKANDVTEAF